MVYTPVITNKETGNRVHFAEWVAVADRLPDDDEIVLVSCPNESEPVWMGYLDGETGEWRDTSAAWIETGVTHWMPLPEPPCVS